MPRLPIDTVLLVIGAHDLGDAAALLQAWRDARMPVVHAGSGAADDAALPSHELTIVGREGSAFADMLLADWLDARGTTTLVVCGPRLDNAAEATARDAVARGLRVFVADGAGHARLAGDLTAAGTPALIQAAALARAIRDRHGR